MKARSTPPGSWFLRSSALLLAACLISGCDAVQPERWQEPAPPQEFVVRRLPAASFIDAEVTGSVLKDWGKGLRLNSLYLAQSRSPLSLPIIITSPDWEVGQLPPESGVFSVRSLLEQRANHGFPQQKGLAVLNLPEEVVAGMSWRGSYTSGEVRQTAQRLFDYLEREQIPQLGPPRIVLYSNPDFTPEGLRAGEVQVPIPQELGSTR